MSTLLACRTVYSCQQFRTILREVFLHLASLSAIVSIMADIVIHTDGGCSGNPGPGGWAYVMRYEDRVKEASGHTSLTTNNRMELQAVIEALSFIRERRQAVLKKLETTLSSSTQDPDWLKARIKVYTDSQYVKNGVTSWISAWKAKGWKTADRKPVKNQDLWMNLDELTSALTPSYFWVEGHAGVPDNERCDTLVREATAAAKWDQRGSNPRPTA